MPPPDAADKLYKRAVESNPHDPDAFINYAHFLRTEKRDNDAAEALLQSAVASNPCGVAPLTAYAEFLMVGQPLPTDAHSEPH